jgi:SAM-dependent methyltransferase
MSCDVSRGATKGRKLPPRYDERWRDPFDNRVDLALRPGISILDVGAGASPTIRVDRRPPRCFYAGLDLSLAELQRAASGSYDEFCVADVAVRAPGLVDRFDLVLSWNALEHVRPLDRAFEHLRMYLRPAGRLVALFSGRFSVFGTLNRLVPRRVAVELMKRLLDRDPTSVWPAYYDRCWYDEIMRMLGHWERVEVLPLYRGAEYFNFSPNLRSLYLGYENWACRTRRRNLATHYLVTAVR